MGKKDENTNEIWWNHLGEKEELLESSLTKVEGDGYSYSIEIPNHWGGKYTYSDENNSIIKIEIYGKQQVTAHYRFDNLDSLKLQD